MNALQENVKFNSISWLPLIACNAVICSSRRRKHLEQKLLAYVVCIHPTTTWGLWGFVLFFLFPDNAEHTENKLFLKSSGWHKWTKVNVLRQVLILSPLFYCYHFCFGDLLQESCYKLKLYAAIEANSTPVLSFRPSASFHILSRLELQRILIKTPDACKDISHQQDSSLATIQVRWCRIGSGSGS